MQIKDWLHYYSQNALETPRFTPETLNNNTIVM